MEFVLFFHMGERIEDTQAAKWWRIIRMSVCCVNLIPTNSLGFTGLRLVWLKSWLSNFYANVFFASQTYNTFLPCSLVLFLCNHLSSFIWTKTRQLCQTSASVGVVVCVVGITLRLPELVTHEVSTDVRHGFQGKKCWTPPLQLPNSSELLKFLTVWKAAHSFGLCVQHCNRNISKAVIPGETCLQVISISVTVPANSGKADSMPILLTMETHIFYTWYCCIVLT